MRILVVANVLVCCLTVVGAVMSWQTAGAIDGFFADRQKRMPEFTRTLAETTDAEKLKERIRRTEAGFESHIRDQREMLRIATGIFIGFGLLSGANAALFMKRSTKCQHPVAD
jgi:hypothetical protein